VNSWVDVITNFGYLGWLFLRGKESYQLRAGFTAS
jgi:hypothetical protein